MTGHNTPRSKACATLQEDLVLFYYGELQGTALHEMAGHVKTCDSCRATLAEISTLLPLTRLPDAPPQAFWDAYSREMREKLDRVASPEAWWRKLAAFFGPIRLPALATATAAIMVLFLTVGKNFWQSPAPPPKDVTMMEVLPMTENLEFFRAMEVLDSLDLLEFMSNSDNGAA